MPGRSTSTDPPGRELLRLGAVVLLLGIAFITLLVDQTQALAGPGVGRPPASGVAEPRGLAPIPAVARSGLAATGPASDVIEGMRVRVPRLGIDLPLLHGDTGRDVVLRSTPSGAAFLLPSTDPPGSGGNSYIYAHARPGMFLSLWEVRLGDVVEVTESSGQVRRYAVTEIHAHVVPTDVRYTQPTDDERITLQTSTGPRDTDPRFIVVAVRGN